MTIYINRAVDGCESCQHVGSVTQKPFDTLELLPRTAGPWKAISHDLITGLPVSNKFDNILKVMDQLTETTHFVPSREK